MTTPIFWDEMKRQANLDKHGLDFIDAVMVLESPFRLDVVTVRGGEQRTQSFAYVFDVLAVLAVVHGCACNPRRDPADRQLPASKRRGKERLPWLARK